MNNNKITNITILQNKYILIIKSYGFDYDQTLFQNKMNNSDNRNLSP